MSMITAVDTNIFIDIFSADPKFGQKSKKALQLARSQGKLLICEVVYAEISGNFEDQQKQDRLLSSFDVSVEPIGKKAAYIAGQLFTKYRQSAKEQPRTTILSDFFVAAHALISADRLLSRDRGFYRSRFKTLKVIAP